ncbi:DUF6344 domain-containing protein [Streptomyces sp. TP-A0356]|uniref:DUF6344 domain-containing protein n=1 Tax=Streptomyces sp. TP-A0356 TaxID=1359208 RepID=UPI0006E2A08E|nr:DUF6344 domain-containing protein [Streptomyces sp. TP-A0356]
MARNTVMKLWTAVVTAFLALCTALGLITTTATTAAAVPQAQPARNSGTEVTLPKPAQGSWARARSLPPTMKQRIRAEAHGSSPACRHRPLTTTAPTIPLARSALRTRADPARVLEPTAPLQR